MDSVGRYQEVAEADGKRSFVFSPVIFSGEPAIDSGEAEDLISETMFLCPTARVKSAIRQRDDKSSTPGSVKIDSSPHFHGVAQHIEYADDYKRVDPFNHHVLPLFWCKNEHEHWSEKCLACYGGDSNVGSDFYFCGTCDEKYHKECIQSPLRINHPSYPKHPLQLCYDMQFSNCFHCKKDTNKMVYRSTLAKFIMHPICAREPVSCVIEQCKRHDHPLTFFTRQASLDCNVCGLISAFHPTYVCLECNFVAHRDCVDSPHVIRISRHHHRISFSLFLSQGNQSCGVCRKEVNREYGGYTCNKCDDYVFHSRCALRDDIWDGEELAGVPEEDDMEEVAEPFERISDGIILHFSHKHLLRVQTSTVYEESKICDACVIPIYEGDFYSCGECDFILHETCANAPRKKRHPLHPHPLTLTISNFINGNGISGYPRCHACIYEGSGFVYECRTKRCQFNIDVRCASIYEPYDYQGHEHPLFLALDPAGERKYCQVCQSFDNNSLLNCIECDYIICFNCVTLPYKVRYKHDKHFLTLGFGDETSKSDWCEACEELLPTGREERFYTCDQCCTTLHIQCLLGKDRYMKPGVVINKTRDVKVFPNNSLSRPTCDYCNSRCANNIFLRGETETWCSVICFFAESQRVENSMSFPF